MSTESDIVTIPPELPATVAPRQAVFARGDRVRHCVDRSSCGVVASVGSRPGVDRSVRRYYVWWDGSRAASWVDEERLEPEMTV
jgi:hypothetical protein